MHVEPGVYPNVPFDDYARWDAINWSVLKHFRTSALHARQHIICPDDSSPAMQLGTAVHTAVLEPDEYSKQFAVAPKCDKRTKKGKEDWAAFEAANEDKIILTGEEDFSAKAMGAAVHAHAVAGPFVRDKGPNEVSICWMDPEFKVLCKGRLDLLRKHAGHSANGDLKSTRNISPDAFARDAAKYGYHAQIAGYRKGLDILKPGPTRKSYIVACENHQPFDAAMYEPDEATMDEGLTLYDHCLSRYATAKKKNLWPGCAPGLTPLALPPWAYRFVSLGDYR